MIPVFCKRKHLWQEVGAAFICGHKDKYLEGGNYTCVKNTLLLHFYYFFLEILINLGYGR